MDQEYTPLDLSTLDLSTPLPTYPADFRSGFASLVGRPNAGKSTLTNAMVGQKVAITSNRPQTTRHTIRGIVHKDEYQLILVDTPVFTAPALCWVSV
ncbi:GTPase [Rothia mucilaginosa]|uniref:GTPase n=1 Tax=Rothia mucilaginosa TaxID=43675 RepID=UPI003F6568CA